jgi:hypothetical protein
VHVFLVGFVRSGTTLLEQVLAAHPQVVALDEKPTLAKAEQLLIYAPGGLERLETLDPDTATRLRADYWQVVRDHGVEPRGKVFIDKMPMATVDLPLIERLFPDARILFAKRDPRDVVLSAFRRMFRPNAATFQMLTAEGAAALYDRVMRLAEAYRRVLPLRLRDVRYEDLVADFEGETRSICAFLGLDWHEDVRAFAAKAAAREVSTPSAVQIRKGLYKDGAGQWRAYAEQLAPVMPVLAPWVERFGYAP